MDELRLKLAERHDFENIFNEGNNYAEDKNYDIALQYFDRATELNPNEFLAFFNKGLTLKNLERYNEAINCFDMVLNLIEQWEYKKIDAMNKYHKNSCINKGNCLLMIENINQALDTFKKDSNILLKDKVDMLITAGEKSYNVNNKFNHAINCFNLAIKMDKKQYEAWYNLGNVFFRLGEIEPNTDKSKINFKNAIKFYSKAAKLNSKDSDIYTNLGITFAKIEEYKKAIKFLNKSLSINPYDELANAKKNSIIEKLK